MLETRVELMNHSISSNDPTAVTDSIMVNRRVLQQLHQQGVIDTDGLRCAKSQLFSAVQWALWIMRLAIGLGTALLLCGVVFFFAYNWHDMPKWSKFTVIEAAILGCFALSAVIGVRTFVGQCLLLSASVLIGVFLAVFGQIYQTGADSWQLFALWGVLILGFLPLSQFAPQWVLQWTVIGIALWLWLIIPYHLWSRNTSMVTLMLFYVVAVWGIQQWLKPRWQWLNHHWLSLLTLLIVQGIAVINFTLALFEDGQMLQLMIIIAIVTGIGWYHNRHWDLLAQVLSLATLALFIWLMVFNQLFENMWLSNLLMQIIIMLITTIGLSVGLFQLIMKLKQSGGTDAS